MLKPVFAALLLVLPISAFAQSTTHTGSSAGTAAAAQPGPTANQNNPQAEANQAGQPSNAKTTPGTGAATSIPTPTLSHKSQPVPQGQGISK
jgi:hypothetical protein